MKFVYEFRTSDNARHDGVVSAATRDDAYRLLKEKGVRPSRLAEAPGLLNKFLGKGKRWTAIAMLLALVIAFAVVIHSDNQTIRTVEAQLDSALPRHQIPGLPDNWGGLIDRLFADPLDRLLARYAQPGEIVSSSPDKDASVPLAADGAALEELRRVVVGMRQEAKGFLSLGKSMDDLERFLEERQRMEADFRKRTMQQVRSGEMAVEEANQVLSAMELKILKKSSSPPLTPYHQK